MIVGRLTVDWVIAPIGEAIFLVRVNVATNIFLGATAEGSHRRRADDHQRHRRARFTFAKLVFIRLFHADNIPRQATNVLTYSGSASMAW